MPFHRELFSRVGREARKIVIPAITGIAGGLLGAAGERLGGFLGGLEERIAGRGRRVSPLPGGRVALLPGAGISAPASPGIAGPPLDIGIPFSKEEFVGIPQALPGGAQTRAAVGLGGIGSALGRLLPGVAGGIAATGLFDIFGGGGDDLPDLPGVPPGGIFRVVGPTIRARHLVRVTNPMTGRDVWYRNVGRPILFAGDLRTCKRVEKVARLARRSSRKR